MKLPSPVAVGGAVSAKAFNELLQYVKALQISGGPGVRVQRSAVGTTIALGEIRPVRGVAGGSDPVPFEVSASGLSATVYPGLCNGEMPEIGGTPLDNPTPPTLTLTNNATNYIYLKQEGTFDSGTGAETLDTPVVAVAGSVPADTATDTGWEGHALIAVVVVVSGVVTGITQFLDYDVGFQNFGQNNYYFVQ